MKTINFFAFLTAIVLLLGACSTPKLGYFQDIQSGQLHNLNAPVLVKIQPGDKLSILVSSKTPELAYLYNLPVVGHYQSSTSGRSLQTSTVASYTVAQDGSIEFPVIGKLNIAGKTRSEVAEYIRGILIGGDHLKDATVTVDFLDMYFSVMGEVKTPGRFIIDHDKVTLLDALSQAGDLTINGVRNNVLVMREENGVKTAYRVDLTNADQLYSSPAFYLKQNDIVYVEPNAKRARESTGTGNAFQNPSLWISLASLLTTITVLIVK